MLRMLGPVSAAESVKSGEISKDIRNCEPKGLCTCFVLGGPSFAGWCRILVLVHEITPQSPNRNQATCA
jgi:hypothetical protein